MQRKVATKRIISPDGKVIAEVTSEVVTSDEQDDVHQAVAVATDGTHTRVAGYSHTSSIGSTQVRSRISVDSWRF